MAHSPGAYGAGLVTGLDTGAELSDVQDGSAMYKLAEEVRCPHTEVLPGMVES